MIKEIWPFIFLTVLLFGGCAWLTGQALARSWRPMWQMVPYMLGLACADRFLHFALFNGELLSIKGYFIHAAVLLALGLLAFRLTLSKRMASQYPWALERVGLFGWKEREETQTKIAQ